MQANMTSCITAAGGMRNVIYMHAGFMFVGWGVMIPIGVILARFAKHFPNALWFTLHWRIQSVGLIVAIIGWAIALVNFNVFGSVGTRSYYHGIFGMITMLLGILQPINAFLRPHNPEEGETKSSLRLAWEILHKASGYIAVILGAFTIVLGSFLLPMVSDQTVLRVVYGIVLALFLGLIVYLVLNAKKMQESKKKVPRKEEDA